MSNGEVARQHRKRVRVKGLIDVAHGLSMPNLSAIRRRNAGALLTSVLQGIQTQIGQVRGFGVAEDPKHATLIAEFVEHVT